MTGEATGVVAYAPDLMDASRLRGRGVTVVGSLDELATTPARLVLLDLTRPGALAAVAAMPCPVVGFAPHVDVALMDAGRAAGCVEVVPRSRLFRNLEEIIAP